MRNLIGRKAAYGCNDGMPTALKFVQKPYQEAVNPLEQFESCASLDEAGQSVSVSTSDLVIL